jgi:hypothetical protein
VGWKWYIINREYGGRGKKEKNMRKRRMGKYGNTHTPARREGPVADSPPGRSLK